MKTRLVEEYHKSLKQNASLERSPTQTETTQTNHFFAALCGYIKLERLKIKTKKNHFALKSKLYLKALLSAFQTLQELNQSHLSAYGEISTFAFLIFADIFVPDFGMFFDKFVEHMGAFA